MDHPFALKKNLCTRPVRSLALPLPMKVNLQCSDQSTVYWNESKHKVFSVQTRTCLFKTGYSFLGKFEKKRAGVAKGFDIKGAHNYNVKPCPIFKISISIKILIFDGALCTVIPL